MPTPAQVAFAAANATAQAAIAAQPGQEWAGSPYRWLRELSSTRRGAAGERLLAEFLTNQDIPVTGRAAGRAGDRVVAGRAVEFKLSTRWAGGEYVFQQLRDQDYDDVALLGISPQQVHLWWLPKTVAWTLARPQHGGASGRDTRWLRFPADTPPAALATYGGTLEEAAAVLAPLATAT